MGPFCTSFSEAKKSLHFDFPGTTAQLEWIGWYSGPLIIIPCIEMALRSCWAAVEISASWGNGIVGFFLLINVEEHENCVQEVGG